MNETRTNASNRMSPLQHIIALLTALALSSCAFAQGITAQISSPQGFPNEPVRVVVKVLNLESFDGPFVDETEGLEIKRLPGEQTSSSFTNINGRNISQRTVAMSFEVTAMREGSFEIPPFRVEAEGKTYRSQPLRLKVVPADATVLAMARIVGEPSAIYVGQRGAMNLEILVRRYSDQALGITLDEQSMWSLVDMQSSSWGVFGPKLQEMLSQNRRPRGDLRVVDGVEYFVYTVSRPFEPIAMGTPSAGDVRIRIEYPLRLQRDNNFFQQNRLSLAQSRTLSVRPASVDVSVLPLPEGGRPATWNGAVGDFELLVVAKPLEVAVGDPITLTMRLTDRSGAASLDGLQAPALGSQPRFSAGFRVPEESVAGTVEARSKIFTQSIRALSETVREIPSVEFSFFDPTTGEYRTVQSAPIAIKVKPSAVVRVDADVPVARDPSKPAFTKVEGGLLANASAAECAARDTATGGMLVLGIAPPLAFLALGAIGARMRGARDPRLLRRARALAVLEDALATRRDAASIEDHMLAYIAGRTGARPAGFARRDALEALAAHAVDAQLVEQTDRLLRQCERARYHGEEIDPATVRDLAQRLESATAGIVLAPSARDESGHAGADSTSAADATGNGSAAA